MPPLPVLLILTAFFAYFFWRGTPASSRVSTRLAILLALYVNGVLWTTNWLAARAATKLFLLVEFGIDAAVRDGVQIVWWSRTQIILSNGKEMGQGASQVLQFISLACWIALLVALFFATRSLLAAIAPRVYRSYAMLFRAWVKPSVSK